jgi:hypothetical protein
MWIRTLFKQIKNTLTNRAFSLRKTILCVLATKFTHELLHCSACKIQAITIISQVIPMAIRCKHKTTWEEFLWGQFGGRKRIVLPHQAFILKKDKKKLKTLYFTLLLLTVIMSLIQDQIEKLSSNLTLPAFSRKAIIKYVKNVMDLFVTKDGRICSKGWRTELHISQAHNHDRVIL